MFGNYLDRNVSLERGGFEFKMEQDLVLGISQGEIEKKAATIAKESIGPDIPSGRKKRKARSVLCGRGSTLAQGDSDQVT